MSTFNGPPSGWSFNNITNLGAPDFDGDPRTYQEAELVPYHWGLMYAASRQKPAQMIWDKPTVPFKLAIEADIIVRYDVNTFEAVVTKFRYGPDNIPLEEALEILENHEKYQAEQEELAKKSLVDGELGTLWNPNPK